MEQQLRNLFTEKPFSAEGLNVQGYSIIEIGKGKVKKGKIFEGSEIQVDAGHLLEVLEKDGKVYGYTKKGVLKALYVLKAEKHDYSCEEVYFASDVEGEPVTGLMDQQVVFLMAQRASYYKDGSAVFHGQKVPKLVQKAGAYSWYWAAVFGILYSVAFTSVLKNPGGIAVGMMLGVAMGNCFRSTKYEYEQEKQSAFKEEIV